jgi:preprotein translocase subunit SecD
MLDFPRWKIAIVLLPVVLGLFFALPNLFSARQVASWPSFMWSKQIALGLDLQGGSHILLEISSAEILAGKLDNIEQGLETRLRTDNKTIDMATPQISGRSVSFLVRNAQDVDTVVEALRSQRQPLQSGLGTYDYDVTVQDSTRVIATVTESGVAERQRSALEQSVEVVRRRVDALGTREPSITREGQDRIVVQVPGLQDPSELKRLIGKTAKLEFKMVDERTTADMIANNRAAPGAQLLPAQDGRSRVAVRRRADITGENLIDAQATTSQQSIGYEVSFRLDAVGAQRFATVTRNNVGKPFAIILDGVVISAPTINSPITGGSGVITGGAGGFDPKEATELATLLRAGALPAKLTVLEERTVGPDLGADSIRAGTIASIIGTIALALFMIATYGRFGVYAVIALFVNIALIFGAMTLFGFTLTLPGIAGLVLTIGAAVDANVLIFERIREELRAGRNTMHALESGYTEASRTIFDANMTNVIAAIVMLLFGSGPIKGFAILLLIGIITSVFTAVTFCRMMTALYVRRARPARLIL